MISVIIPAYNAGRTLAACLDSLCAQTHTDWQGIIIDDGSTDNTPAIAEQYAAQDSRITVLHQTKSGVSTARNAGLDAATGEYIAFIDADDTVLPTYLQHMAEAAQGADYVMAGTKIVPAGVCYPIENKRYTTLTDMRVFVKEYGHTNTLGNVCSKLLRRNIVNEHNLRYNKKLRFSEDDVFNLTYLSYCKSAATVADADYLQLIPKTQCGEYKYHLTLEECTYCVDCMIASHDAIEQAIGQRPSPALLMHHLPLLHSSYIFAPAAADEYLALYQRVCPQHTLQDLLNDEFCSPLLKFAYLLKVTPPSELRAAQGLMQAFADSTWAQHAAHVRYPSRLIAAIVRLAAARHYTLLTLLLRLRQALSRLKIKA